MTRRARRDVGGEGVTKIPQIVANVGSKTRGIVKRYTCVISVCTDRCKILREPERTNKNKDDGIGSLLGDVAQ